MADYNSYRRSRPRGGRAAPPASDAIVVALTAQVLLCIILLLAAVLAKKADETRYSDVKQQYNVLVTQGEVDLGGRPDLDGGLQGIFASIEDFITSLVAKFTGGEEAQPPIVAEVVPEPGVDEPSIDEPILPDEEPPETEEAQPAMEFNYNYLSSGEALSSEDFVSTGLGRGGAFPVNIAGEDPAALPAPEGSTYAQVELGGKIQPPVTGVITSEFSYREHPVSGNDDFHTGMDIAAVEGRDILAALPGVVAEVGESEIYGNYITLRHTSGLQTFYAHCSEIIAAEGAVVRQGERIAKVGQTGVATGPHLHFSVIVDGKYTDPYWVLKDNIQLVGES